MVTFKYDIDKILNPVYAGYIPIDEILTFISQEEIFSVIFNYLPIEGVKIKSPFRQDHNPGCFFKTVNGILYFYDYANCDTYLNIPLYKLSCFQAIQVYFKLSNLYDSLYWVKTNLIDNKNLKPIHNPYELLNLKTKTTQIYVRVRRFDQRDKRYWLQYGIHCKMLKKDKVYPLESFAIDSSKFTAFNCTSIAYAYTEFESNRKKLYFPTSDRRFITNCTNDDVGGLKSLKKTDKLIITKSYKDYRVLKNIGYTSVWFQNEGMKPSLPIIEKLCKKAKLIYIFFDNDETGIKAGRVISDYINHMKPNKAQSIHLRPCLLARYNVKDPSDYYCKFGEQKLINQLKKLIP